MLQPLAERLRPQNLDEYIGQEHLVGKGAILRRMIDAGQISSFILWGPPGVGKTTLAKIISNQLDVPFYTLSAIHSGVKDVRDVIEKCKKRIYAKSKEIIEDNKIAYSYLSYLYNFLVEFDTRFKEEKRVQGVAEFNDIMHYALELLLDKE